MVNGEWVNSEWQMAIKEVWQLFHGDIAEDSRFFLENRESHSSD